MIDFDRLVTPGVQPRLRLRLLSFLQKKDPYAMLILPVVISSTLVKTRPYSYFKEIDAH